MRIDSRAQKIASETKIRQLWKEMEGMPHIGLGIILNPAAPSDLLEKIWTSLPKDPFVDQSIIVHAKVTQDLIKKIEETSDNAGTKYLAQDQIRKNNGS